MEEEKIPSGAVKKSHSEEFNFVSYDVKYEASSVTDSDPESPRENESSLPDPDVNTVKINSQGLLDPYAGMKERVKKFKNVSRLSCPCQCVP